MAKQILAQQDFNWIELLKVRAQNLASAPASPQPGWVYYDTTLGKLRVCTNATGPVWVSLDGSDIPDSTVTSQKIVDGTIMNVDINASAGIALSKLALDPTLRSNHSGSQLAATISDFTEAAQDAAAAALTAGAHGGGISVTYDDAGNAVAVSLSNTEAFQDVVGAFLAVATGNAGISVAYDDANNRVNFVVTDSPTVAGQTPAQLRDRSTHTGTQTASSISDLTSVVQAYRLDQFAVPTADLNINGRKLTSLADPTNPQDAATKNYVDLARQGVRLKDSVVAASTVNLTLSGTQTVDGVALVAGDRILVKNQTTASQNGIYVVAAGAWTRAADADAFGELNDGATVWVNQGAQANTTWSQINTLTALTDAQSWSQQGAAASYTGGNGLTLTGQTFDVGQGTGVVVAADTVSVDTAVVARKINAVVGNGAATTIAVTHSLGNQWVTAQVFRNSTPWDLIDCEVQLTDTNTVTVIFAAAPAASAYRVLVTG